jgi:hypothetical protein
MTVPTSPLTETQRLYNLVREAADAAADEARVVGDPAQPDAQFHTGRQAAFVTVLGMIEEVDPEANTWDDHVPGRVYGSRS